MKKKDSEIFVSNGMNIIQLNKYAFYEQFIYDIDYAKTKCLLCPCTQWINKLELF